MPQDGIYWYTDPSVIGQKFSAFASEIDDELGDILSKALDKATESMRQSVMTRGVYQGAPTGGPRIRTGAMYNAIDSDMNRNAKGRIAGSFGFKDAPFYTAFQEPGTRSTGWGQGIAPMHAFADAQVEFVDEIETLMANFGGNIWENF